MGYRTYYSLTITGDSFNGAELDTSKLIDELRANNESAAYALESNGCQSAHAKWYEHENDLKEFSKKYPNNTFILSGEGEEFPDLWKKRFINGKMARVDAVISYPDFS
jgi:hypothetical protein